MTWRYTCKGTLYTNFWLTAVTSVLKSVHRSRVVWRYLDRYSCEVKQNMVDRIPLFISISAFSWYFCLHMSVNTTIHFQGHRERGGGMGWWLLVSPTWDWDLSNFPVVRSRGLTQAKNTWPCKHCVLTSNTIMTSQEADADMARRGWKSTLFVTFSLLHLLHFARRRKLINHHIAGRTRESHPRVQDLQHPRLGKPRRGLQILDTRMGFSRPSRNVVIDSIILQHSTIWY